MARHGGEYFVTGGAHNHGSDKDELARIDAVRACLTGQKVAGSGFKWHLKKEETRKHLTKRVTLKLIL